MAEELLEAQPLPHLFEQAQHIYLLASSSQVEPTEIRKACRMLQEAQDKIETLALFSANEDKEDISSADLKYLLVPYYLGYLTEKLPVEDRAELVKVAKVQLLAFIRSCERLELLSESEAQALSREDPPTPEARRAEKVARFKRQRAAESKLQDIKERKERRRRSMQAAAKATVVEHGEEDLPDEDDEEEREAWFMHISLALCKALDLVEMLKREYEMLAAIQAINEEGKEVLTREILDERQSRAESWHKEGASKARTLGPAQPITCATYAQDVIEGRAAIDQGHKHSHGAPFLFGPASVVSGSLSTERERLVAQVFQPSHSLPSMSIEEAGLAEMEMMRTWNEANQKLADEAKSSWVGEAKKDESDDEESEYKARAWDDWKDEHPRGAGNKKLTPCG